MNKSIAMLGISSIILMACSQPPAPIAHKGNQFYGKDSNRQYASTAKPDYTPPAPAVAAPVKQMQVADLPEPKKIAAREPIKVAELTQPKIEFKREVVAEPALEPLPMEALADSQQVPISEAKMVMGGKATRLGDLNGRASNFIWPVEGKIVSRFGPKKNGLINDGINIAAQEGEPIWAASAGEVVYAGNELKGYGNMMIIRHANGWMSAYAHASDMLMNKGDRVEQGDLIGYVGKTGAVNTAQLHFGIREGKTPVNPEGLLPRRMASAQ